VPGCATTLTALSSPHRASLAGSPSLTHRPLLVVPEARCPLEAQRARTVPRACVDGNGLQCTGCDGNDNRPTAWGEKQDGPGKAKKAQGTKKSMVRAKKKRSQYAKRRRDSDSERERDRQREAERERPYQGSSSLRHEADLERATSCGPAGPVGP
jgi:hypothetical protein